MGSINRPKKGCILRKEPIRDENDILLIKEILKYNKRDLLSLYWQ